MSYSHLPTFPETYKLFFLTMVYPLFDFFKKFSVVHIRSFYDSVGRGGVVTPASKENGTVKNKYDL